jgi:hypothetical protein
MTNEQILWLSRVRVGLQRAGIPVDLVRVTRDRPYLEAVLTRASELTDVTAVESSMKLMSQLGMINGSNVMDPGHSSAITRSPNLGGGLDFASQQALRGGAPAAVPAPGGGALSTSSQSDPAPIELGRFSTPMGATTGTSPAPVAGGKQYKRGLR